jgi:hypothetical protein
MLERAFRCYDALYTNQPNRDFFMELCREDEKLSKWAGLPKFDVLAIRKFEEEILSTGK